MKYEEFMELIDSLTMYELLQNHTDMTIETLFEIYKNGTYYLSEEIQEEYNEIYSDLEDKWSKILNYERI